MRRVKSAPALLTAAIAVAVLLPERDFNAGTEGLVPQVYNMETARKHLKATVDRNPNHSFMNTFMQLPPLALKALQIVRNGWVNSMISVTREFSYKIVDLVEFPRVGMRMYEIIFVFKPCPYGNHPFYHAHHVVVPLLKLRPVVKGPNTIRAVNMLNHILHICDAMLRAMIQCNATTHWGPEYLMELTKSPLRNRIDTFGIGEPWLNALKAVADMVAGYAKQRRLYRVDMDSHYVLWG